MHDHTLAHLSGGRVTKWQPPEHPAVTEAKKRAALAAGMQPLSGSNTVRLGTSQSSRQFAEAQGLKVPEQIDWSAFLDEDE